LRVGGAMKQRYPMSAAGSVLTCLGAYSFFAAVRWPNVEKHTRYFIGCGSRVAGILGGSATMSGAPGGNEARPPVQQEPDKAKSPPDLQQINTRVAQTNPEASPSSTRSRFRKCSVKFTDVETKAGKLGKKYTSFTIVMRMGKTTWCMQKRYRDFYGLNSRLQKSLHRLKELNFPPKKWFGSLARKTVLTRKAQLEQYIKSLLQLQVCSGIQR